MILLAGFFGAKCMWVHSCVRIYDYLNLNCVKSEGTDGNACTMRGDFTGLFVKTCGVCTYVRTLMQRCIAKEKESLKEAPRDLGPPNHVMVERVSLFFEKSCLC